MKALKLNFLMIFLCAVATAQSVIPSPATVAQLNNRIYVDGTKYTLTQAGIQQAFTDASAVNVFGPGTSVYLPPMTYSGGGFTLTCPLNVQGAGEGQTVLIATSGDLFTLSPSGNFSQNQKWEFSRMHLVANAGNDVNTSDVPPDFRSASCTSMTTSWRLTATRAQSLLTMGSSPTRGLTGGLRATSY